VTGVAYFDADNRLREQPAELVVCGGRLNPAAAVEFEEPFHPQGSATATTGGAQFAGAHLRGANGLFDEVVYDDIGPGRHRHLRLQSRKSRAGGGGLLANESSVYLPVHRPCAARVPGWAKRTRFHAPRLSPQHRHTGPAQESVFDSRVQADPVVKDYWAFRWRRLSGGRMRTPSRLAIF